jgi:hypothetical protein
VPGAEAADNPPAADRRVTLGTTTLPDLVCAVKAAGLTTVETAWVAASPKQAHALLTGTTSAAKPHVDGADEVFSGGSPEFLWIRVGRYIERIDSADAREGIRVASAVAKQLRKRR